MHLAANCKPVTTPADPSLKLTYCILHGQIKGFNSSITTILFELVVIELRLGSYKTLG